MSNSAPALAARDIRPIADAPVARHVIFEIGVYLAAHLTIALAVTAIVQSFTPFA